MNDCLSRITQFLQSSPVPNAEEILRDRALWDKWMRCGAVVGARILKLIISEFCYEWYPTDDTGQLSHRKNTLMSGECVTEMFAPLHADDVYIVLAAWTDARGIAAASSWVAPRLPPFAEGRARHTDLPTLWSALHPQGTRPPPSVRDRLLAIRDELQRRGYVVKEPRPSMRREGAFAVEVVHIGASPTIYDNYETEEIALEMAIVNTAKTVVHRLQQSKKMTMNEKRGDSGIVKSIEEMNDDFRMSLCNHAFSALRGILRLHAQYRNLLERDKLLDDILKSHGWIPLRVAHEYVEHEQRLNETLRKFSTITESQLKDLLLFHDYLQRFEVGIAPVGTPLAGVECCRAIYAHDAIEGSDALFDSILREQREVTSVEDLPDREWWILRDNRDLRELPKKGWRLYEKCVFVFAVCRATVDDIQHYRQNPLSQFDSKLRGNICFLGVDAHACIRDAQMKVYQLPKRGDRPGGLILLPIGERYRTRHLAFPMDLLTNNVISMRHDELQVTRMERTKDPCVKFAAEDLAALGVRHSEDAVDAPTTTVVRSGPPAAMVVDPILKEVDEFDRDDSRIEFQLRIPKLNPDGTNISCRQQTLTDIKKYIVDKNLRYELVSTDGGALEEVFLVRKAKDFPPKILMELEEYLLREEKFTDPKLLEMAVTRECVNKESNYERLEFIGDAVLDVILIWDTVRMSLHPISGTLGVWNANNIANANADQCRNDVLCHLLPEMISRYFAERSIDIDTKTQADIVEALIGAVYIDGKGFETVRRVICRIYQRLLEAPNTDQMLKLARDNSPYLRDDSSTDDIISHLQRDKAFTNVIRLPIPEQDTARPNHAKEMIYKLRVEPHAAGRFLPRIQDKAFATHFTTGPMMSYRRVMDTTVVMQRILRLHAEGSVAFVNEQLTDMITMTFDFDGMSVTYDGVYRIITKFCAEKYPAGVGIILDCSGASKAKKGKWKHSCHIHFPQVALSLDELRVLTGQLRTHIIEQLNSGSDPTQHKLPGQLVSAGDQGAGGNVVVGRVLSSFSEFTRAFPGGTPSPPPCVAFCGILTLLRLRGVNQRLRRWALHALGYALGNGTQDLTKFRRSFGAQRNRCIVRPLSADFGVPHAMDESFLDVYPEKSDSTNKIVVLSTEADMKSISIPGKDAKARENLKGQIEASARSSLRWEKTLDSGLVMSRKLRTYLCDKWDTVYNQELRPLRLQWVLDPHHGPVKVDETTEHTGAPPFEHYISDQGPPAFANSTTLHLSEMRMPFCYDVDGRLHTCWEAADSLHLDGDGQAVVPPPLKESELPQSDISVFLSAAMVVIPHREKNAAALYPWTVRLDPSRTRGTLFMGDEPYLTSPIDAVLPHAATFIIPHVRYAAARPIPLKPILTHDDFATTRTTATGGGGGGGAPAAAATPPPVPRMPTHPVAHSRKAIAVLGPCEGDVPRAWESAVRRLRHGHVGGLAWVALSLATRAALRDHPHVYHPRSLPRQGTFAVVVVVDALGNEHTLANILEAVDQSGTIIVATREDYAMVKRYIY